MILDSGENCVRSVSWHFRWFFGSCWATLARALSVPGRSFVLGARNCTAEGYEPVFALLKFVFFLVFPAFFEFFRSGSNMVAFRAKVDGTWQAKFQRRLRHRVTGLRPSGLPNLPFSLVLSFPPFSSASPPFSLFFSNVFSFHPFPSSLLFFFTFFPKFSSKFFFTSSHFQLFPASFGQSDTSPCDPFVSNVPHEAPPTHRI